MTHPTEHWDHTGAPDSTVSSGHMYDLIDPQRLKRRIDLAKKVLRTVEFDTLAFRGMSGAFLGPTLALRLNKSMILVRKEDDDSHSFHKVEGNKLASRYVIVDDFVCSGDTQKAIIDAVAKFAPDASFVGLLEVSYITDMQIEQTIGQGHPYPLR